MGPFPEILLAKYALPDDILNINLNPIKALNVQA